MRLFTLCFVALLTGVGGCQSEEANGPVPPTNLTISYEVATDDSGAVEFNVHADNATYYLFVFGDEPGQTPRRSNTGFIEYEYSESGTYEVLVTAHANESLFISDTESVDVEVYLTIPTAGYSTPLTYPGMTLIWSDEFSDATLNDENWTHESGDGCPNLCGWGNNELEYYSADNTTLQDGHLVIEARQESKGSRAYTSSRIITRDKFSTKYGRIDVRALLPKGQGIWPAIWMLGNSIGTVGWPACGEIDIMEMVGGDGREKTVHGTVHWDHAGQYASYGGHKDLTAGTFADQFHVFTLTWDEEFIRWYVDDVEYHVIDIRPPDLSEFREEFFLIMNVAVGGNWPGNPDATTKFPQRMIVDYVRVFQDE